MSDRKESLLRTLKLQNEQLEQWEHKRTIARDPDEERLCNDKIEDIKKLMLQNETELKKLKGGKIQPAIIPGEAAGPVVNHLEQQHNEIGFNADKKFSENMANNQVSDFTNYNDIGDDFQNRNIEIPPGTNRAIRSMGDDEHVDEHAYFNRRNRSSPEKLKQLFTNYGFIISVLLSAATLMMAIAIELKHEHSVYYKTGGAVVTILVIAVIYWDWYPRRWIKTPGLQFAISMLCCTAYAGSIFGEEILFNKEVGEIVILPLVIITVGSILLLINEEKKKW